MTVKGSNHWRVPCGKAKSRRQASEVHPDGRCPVTTPPRTRIRSVIRPSVHRPPEAHPLPARPPIRRPQERLFPKGSILVESSASEVALRHQIHREILGICPDV